jgi:hypothetical protein
VAQHTTADPWLHRERPTFYATHPGTQACIRPQTRRTPDRYDDTLRGQNAAAGTRSQPDPARLSSRHPDPP